MNINIDHITINVIIQPQEPEHEVVLVNETPRLQEPFKRGHRTPEEIQAKRQQSEQLAVSASLLEHKHLIANKVRELFGVDSANSILAGSF